MGKNQRVDFLERGHDVIDYTPSTWIDEVADAVLRRNRELRAARDPEERDEFLAVVPVGVHRLDVGASGGRVRRAQAYRLEPHDYSTVRANHYRLRYHGFDVAVSDPDDSRDDGSDPIC